MSQNESDTRAKRIHVAGTVQGVGFRPYVHRLASSLSLTGGVANGPRGVTIDVSGSSASVAELVARLPQEVPPGARVESIQVEDLSGGCPEPGFRVLPSEVGPEQNAVVQADVVTCAACLADLFDPASRRRGYPFTTCAECGPRFTIVEALPYDRAGTTMRRFPLCAACQAEYQDPTDRRFHAESIACPDCGPRLIAQAPAEESPLATEEAALRHALDTLSGGGLVALKGLGGWQLVCAADCEAAVGRLRRFKGRPEKPLAVMAPDLASVRQQTSPGAREEQALSSPEGPVVLLPWAGPTPEVGPSVAPGIALLGVMLPTTPLHHLLLRGLGRWLVVTSGNRGGEPIVTDDGEARALLGPGVELLLGHDRPIARRADDSVVRVAAGEALLLRRARGWVALPVRVTQPLRPCVAVGGHQKSTAASARDGEVLVSPHLGDLDGPAARAAHEETVRELLAREPAAVVACDLHPDYASTRLAERLGRPLTRVQHHEAHALSAWAEVGGGSALAVTWDGSGWGPDGTVWGGEAFVLRRPDVTRFARLRRFRLPGGEQAVREPRRSALGLLHAMGGPALIKELAALPSLQSFSSSERAVLVRMLDRGVNAPWTSSVGRLFDGVAALLDLTLRASYEAQAALRVELAAGQRTGGAYELSLVTPRGGGPVELDWEPLLRALLEDLGAGVPVGAIAARFHAGLAEGVVALARRAGQERVLLNGGCFQNARLLEETRDRLEAAGFRVAWPRQLPPNDGGLVLGQLVASAWALERA